MLTRAAISPDQLVTKPMKVMQMPQMILYHTSALGPVKVNRNIHDDGYENRRAKALQQYVGCRFKDGVRDEEDGECRIVLSSGHVMQVLLQSIDLCVSNVRSIEESQ